MHQSTESESIDDLMIEPLHANLRKQVEQTAEVQQEVLPEPLELPEPPPIEEVLPEPASPWGKLAYEKYTLSNATPLDTDELGLEEVDEEPPLR